MFLFVFAKEDEDLIVHIYTNYNPLLNYIARNIMGNEFMAEDMVQEAILRLMDHLPTIQMLEHKALVSYCVRTVESVCFNYLSKASHRKSAEESYRVRTFLPDELLERDEIVHHVKTVLAELSQLDRHLLIYKYFMCYSYKQIGQMLDIEPRYVGTYVKRARDRAGKILKKKGDFE